MNKKIIVTESGLKVLEDELINLKTERRSDVKEKLKIARSYGDLSENSEYDEAKNEQAIVEARIAELEAMLKNAEVLDESEVGKGIVTVGAKVLVYDEDLECEDTYEIVGSAESDPENGRISDESPIGKALVGRKINDIVEVTLPSGDSIKLVVKNIFR